METLLAAKGIKTDFFVAGKKLEAVTDGSFVLGKGEIIGIVGESGSGKSVTMMSLLQLVSAPGRVVDGEVWLEGAEGNILSYEAEGGKMRQIRGGRIGIIFQEPMTSLNPVLTIGYQISENIIQHTGAGKAQAREKAVEMLKLVRIPDAEERYDYYPQQFSGGMRQRIMIAMALAADPDILIADEATTALDVTIQAQLLEMLRDIAEKKNVSIVIVTHNMGIVARYAHRIYVMYSGGVVESANTMDLFTSPEHPYTRGLLRAIPRLNDPKDRVLVPIEGLLPDPADRPPYCIFYERCLYREERCRTLPAPELAPQPGEEHYAACHLSGEERREKSRIVEAVTREVPAKTILPQLCLELRGVSKSFDVRRGGLQRKVGRVSAIEDIGLTLRKGETLGIVGESGCGKTTLARCIMRADRPDSGTILFEGTDITQLPESRLKPVRARMAMVFQDPFSSLDPRQSAESIIGESLRIHRRDMGQAEYAERIRELMRLVELDPKLGNRVPHEFSGGQRQRLGIARALSSDPALLICDEPISSLDVSVQAQIINLLEKLQAELGVSYLFIAHDLAVVRHISDRVLVMYLGRVVEMATCLELYDEPLHPYTRMLLSAVPTADPKSESQRTVVPVAGEVPSVANRPAGCCFCTRCPHATERCHRESPPTKDVGNGHQVACFLY